ncbi:MAG: hypothetical protein OEZ11_15690, partial [Gammaproteobacteria bacterium]|nr:hypothetical protein [Gammaproteobacteria bacterium]
DAALALASSIEIVRGYGDTWERGRERYQAIVSAGDKAAPEKRAEFVRSLLDAALADEQDTLFRQRLADLEAA